MVCTMCGALCDVGDCPCNGGRSESEDEKQLETKEDDDIANAIALTNLL